jgi:hypothetical protein
MRHRIPVFVCGAAVLLAAASPVARASEFEAPFEVSGFNFERLRKDRSGANNRVTIMFNLKAREQLTDLRARVEYRDVFGKKVAKAGPTRIGTVDVGQTKKVSISGIWVPIFNGYLLEFTGSAGGQRKTWQFYGAAGVNVPTYLPEKPIPKQVLLTVLASDLHQDVKSPRAVLYVRVRNLGAVKAEGAHCFLDVYGKKGRALAKKKKADLVGAKGGRPGVVDGGEERLFAIRFARFAGVEGFGVSLGWNQPRAEDSLAGGDFEGRAEVELAKFKFNRPSPKTLEISGMARNGLKSPVENVRVIIRLVKKQKGKAPRPVKTVETVVPDRLAPGDTAVFGLVVDNAPSYDDFEYEVAFEEGGAAVQRRRASGQVILRDIDAVKKGSGGIVIKGEVVNTSPLKIKGVKIDFYLRKGAGVAGEIVGQLTYELPGTLAPRNPKKFEVSADEVPQFDEYFYEVKFAPVGK